MTATPAMTSKKRAELRSECNTLKPMVHLGLEGITPALAKSLDDALRMSAPRKRRTRSPSA